MDCIPNNIQIYFEIDVCQPISHPAHTLPGDLRVVLNKSWVAIHHPRSGLPDDDKRHNDRLLGAPIRFEDLARHPVNEALCLRCGLTHMVEIIGNPR